MPLNDAKIRNAKPTEKPYKLPDGFGLHLEIRPTGTKSWRYRYEIGGKDSIINLGKYPVVSLQEARRERDKIRDLLKQGIDPAQNKKKAKIIKQIDRGNTFRIIANEWLEKQKKKWKSSYTYSQAKNNLENNAFPEIGDLPIRDVTSAHILNILHKMEKRGAETYAINLRQHISGVFKYAVISLKADDDPSAILKGAVQRPEINHSRPMSPEDIGSFLNKLKSYGGNRTTVISMHLILHTFLRTIEIRGGEWSEIDLEKAIWILPAERMKCRRIHLVPLSQQCVALLKELNGISGAGKYLFPNMRNPQKYMSGTTINRALEYMGYETGEWTGHDFRATASTWLNEQEYNPDVIERQMAHVDKNAVRRGYNHAQWIGERARMMQDWSDLVESTQLIDSD